MMVVMLLEASSMLVVMLLEASRRIASRSSSWFIRLISSGVIEAPNGEVHESRESREFASLRVGMAMGTAALQATAELRGAVLDFARVIARGWVSCGFGRDS